jgi:ATP-dependent Lhr-like helicase
VLARLSKPVRDLMLEMGLEELTEPQVRAIPRIAAGANVLIIAPTGSGKTEAALIPVFDALVRGPKDRGISVLYVTPLRALNRDMLGRVTRWANGLGLSVEVRHGDTPVAQRRRQSVKPPNLLITTPETLQAILPGRRMRDNLKGIRWVIVDEVHEIAETKRGAQLSIALERLRIAVGREFQRIGLSATVGSPEEVGKFLAGANRQVEVIQVRIPKGYRYWIEWPEPSEEDHDLAAVLYTSPEAAARIARIRELADQHESTLVFVNSRQIAEMLALRLASLDPKIGIHHGSLSREEREKAEEDFKQRRLRAIICTSTLELGIDIGHVDLVVQYLSPRQVGPLIQRVGRSGHRLGLTSEGVIITAFTDDALESIAVVKRATEEKVERTRLHERALDVLAHQLVGLALDLGGTSERRAIRRLRDAYPFRDISDEEVHAVVSYMVKLRLLLIDDGRIVPTRRGRQYYLANLSMIPDERRYPVVDLTTDRVVGTVGDEFISIRAKVGMNFICRGLVWTIESISEDGRVYVTPVQDPRAALPGWDGEILPVPFELADEVGSLRRLIASKLRDSGTQQASSWLSQTFGVESNVWRRIVEEIDEHLKTGAPLPCDRTIVVEGFDRYLIVNACLGELANRALGYIIDGRLSRISMIRDWWADGYRVLVELPVEVTRQNLETLVHEAMPSTAEEAQEDFDARLAERFPFGYYMKPVAERFGAIERGLALSEDSLLDLYNRFKGTPILGETMREVLQEKVDLDAVKRTISKISKGEVELLTWYSEERPTPISYHIIDRFAEIPETMAPEGAEKDALERVRNSVMFSRVELVCMDCGRRLEPRKISELQEKPRCASCGSALLAILPRYRQHAEEVIRKRVQGEALNDEEKELLSRLRRSADIVNSYGKRGLIALSVYGVGPQTAMRILSKMHYEEDELLRDLLEAKLKYVQTRPYWDRR